MTAAEAIHMVESTPSAYDTLRQALVARGRGGKMATSGSLGNILRGLKDSVIEGFRLRDAGLKHKVALWAVELVGDSVLRGDWGSGGSISGPPTRENESHTDVMAHGKACNAIKDGPRTDPPDPQTPIRYPDPDEWPEGRE